MFYVKNTNMFCQKWEQGKSDGWKQSQKFVEGPSPAVPECESTEHICRAFQSLSVKNHSKDPLYNSVTPT